MNPKMVYSSCAGTSLFTPIATTPRHRERVSLLICIWSSSETALLLGFIRMTAQSIGYAPGLHRESICFSNQIAERELLRLESEGGRIYTLCSNPESENYQNSTGISFVAFGEAQIVGAKDESKYAPLSSYCDDKGAYSSMCPTGQISFKLYDWNPAEFPRRLWLRERFIL